MALLNTLFNNRLAKGVVGGALNALPGYSTLGTQIVNPNVNYQGKANPRGVLGTSGTAKNAAPLGPAVINNPYGGDGGGAGGDVATAAELALYDDQINQLNALLGRADVTQNQGLSQIENTYNRDLGRANEDQSRVLRDYGIKRQDTEQGRESALNTVDSGARSGAANLRRILGLAGSGVSSASQIVAPQAVAKDASMKRGNVLETYGKNFRNLETAETDAKSQFKRLLDDLVYERQNRTSGLLSDVENQRNELRGNLSRAAAERAVAAGGGGDAVRRATAPYSGAIANSGSILDRIFEKYNTAFNVAPVSYQTPELSGYTVDPTSTRLAEQTGAPEETPLLPLLKRRIAAA